MKTYIFTVSEQGVSKNFMANLTIAEYTAIKADLHKCRYSVTASTVCMNTDNESNFKELVEWLATVKLYKKSMIPSDAKVRKIKLPRCVEWNGLGECLEINIGVPFDEHTHCSCVQEAAMILEILKKFPTAVFHHSRARFKLPKAKVKQDDGTIIEYSYQYSMRDKSIVEKTVIFEEVEFEL